MSPSPRSTPTRAATVVLVVVAAIALLAMHGVTGHALETDHAHEIASVVDHAATDPHTPANHDHDHDADADADADGASVHDHGGGDDGHRDGNQPCPTCVHHASALCALIVLGDRPLLCEQPSPAPFASRLTHRPTSRPWSPEPPVPRPSLVEHIH